MPLTIGPSRVAERQAGQLNRLVLSACLSLNIGSRFVVPTVAGSVDLVVHTGIDADGRRTVKEVATVTGRVENDMIESELLFGRRGGDLIRGPGMPTRRDRFEQADIDLDALLGVSSWAG